MSSAGGNTVLLTLGRLPVALELARAFHSAGWRVVVADPARLHLCRMSNAVAQCHRVTAPVRDAGRFLDDLRAIVRDEAVDLVVPVSEETICVSGMAGPLPKIYCSPRRATLELHDKLRFNRLAAEAGLSVPFCVSGADAAAVDWSSAEVVVKPRYSASGRGVRIEKSSALGAVDTSMVVQERLPGEELSGFAMARDGRVEASVVYRARVRSGTVAVCFEREPRAADIERWMATFVGVTEYTGFIAFDFIRDAEGVARAIECNPRATSGLHFLSHAAILAIASGDREIGETDGKVLREARTLMESYSCFTALLSAVGTAERRRTIWREMRGARDVCWTRRDPLPFLLMIINSWPVIWRALTRGQSFAEAAVADIEWQARSD